MRRLPHLVALAALLALGTAVNAAGTVQVEFIEPQHFSDAGRGSWEIERTVKALGEHLTAYGRQLPDGQLLRLEVLDIDLAGELRPTHGASELRILRGRADWPRIDLRYTLTADGRTLKAGVEHLADLNYLQPALAYRGNEAYAYERRMLDRWFSENFKATMATKQ